MNSLTLEQLILLLPELLLLVLAVVIMLLPKQARGFAWVLAAGGLAVDTIMCLSLWGVDQLVLGGAFAINAFTVFVQVMLLGLALINIIGSYDFTNRLYRAREYYALLLCAMLGLLLIPGATDFLTLVIAFELSSLSTYTLPLIERDNPRGGEAALKYFLNGAFASALILYGLSLLYGFTGTLSIEGSAQVLDLLGLHPLPILACVLMLAGFGYKMALVPMHNWAADVYQGSSSPTSGFLSGVTQKGAFIVAIKLLLVTYVAFSSFTALLFGLLCVVTMTVGNVLALRQKDVKRMIAYSSVAHAGNIGVGFAVGTTIGVAGSFVHILAHALMTVGIFFALRLVWERKGGTSMEHFRGLGRQMPALSAAMMLILFSYGGVPPLLGFWGKMIMVVAALGLGGWYTVLALVLVLNSALSLVYYAAVIREMYMRPAELPLLEQPAKASRGVGSYQVALWLSVALLLGIGLLPNLLTELGLEAASAIWLW